MKISIVDFPSWLLTCSFLVVLLSCSDSNKEIPKKNIKTNILLIVADDLGYGDITCYGGDIPTPNIDALAAEGVIFTRFHTSPMCAPTRAMLLTGNDNHIAGIGAQGNNTTEFGYEGKLSDRIVTIPELLKKAGYHTLMAGKWHLGVDSLSDPAHKGFDHSFALIPGAGNHYSDQGVLNDGKSLYRENGKTASWPKGAYSTDFFTDKLKSYIDQKGDKPFFAYAAYTSPHWPLQVDKKYWQQFIGKYDEGYEKLRERRLKSLKEASIIPADVASPPMHERVKPWNSLSDEEKKIEARKMELYAGMVVNLDENVGRLVSHLKKKDLYENTMIVFLSDNGAAHRDFYNSDNFKFLKKYYSNDYENMGNENSYVSYGPQWAESGSAPFRYFKDYATEGGTNTTMIINGKGVQRVNQMSDIFTTVQDLAPTFYELADIEYPSQKGSKKIYPLRGKSILPFLNGKTDKAHDEDYVFAFEHFGNAAVRKGPWKIVNHKKPFDPKNFELYNVIDDITEQNNLKDSHPEIFNNLLTEWNNYSEEVGVQYPTPGGKI